MEIFMTAGSSMLGLSVLDLSLYKKYNTVCKKIWFLNQIKKKIKLFDTFLPKKS